MTLNELFFGALAGAMIVIAGGLYALLFALGRMRNSRSLNYWAVFSYAVLMISTYVLVQALHLHGFWVSVTAVMLVGYFFAPRAIWHLSVATHGEHGEVQKGLPNNNSPNLRTTQ